MSNRDADISSLKHGSLRARRNCSDGSEEKSEDGDELHVEGGFVKELKMRNWGVWCEVMKVVKLIEEMELVDEWKELKMLAVDGKQCRENRDLLYIFKISRLTVDLGPIASDPNLLNPSLAVEQEEPR